MEASLAAEPPAIEPFSRPPRTAESPQGLLHVAPMIDVTDRHFRMLIRCVSDLPVLWTEMTWDRAILYNIPGEPEHARNKNPSRSVESIIGFDEREHPIVMQLGGADPAMLARAARYCAERGYDEINLNCGCPAQTRGRSRNCYGARLMFEPERVAACCRAIGEAAGAVPLTVKCRLGVDDVDSWEELCAFVETVAAAGVSHFIVHARKAILGLDTVKNRSVPPLRHEWVLRLVETYPRLRFTLNGGVTSLEQAAELIRQGAHAVMIGRRSNADPFLFARAGLLHGQLASVSRREVIASYATYATAAQEANWCEQTAEQVVRSLLVPLTGLFFGTPSCGRWKQALSAQMQRRDGLLSTPVAQLIASALEASGIAPAALDERASAAVPRSVGRLPLAASSATNDCPGESKREAKRRRRSAEAAGRVDGEDGAAGAAGGGQIRSSLVAALAHIGAFAARRGSGRGALGAVAAATLCGVVASVLLLRHADTKS